MVIRNKQEIQNIKNSLLEQLKQEHAFWSYETESANSDTVNDDLLIALTMRFLDIQEINTLFTIFSTKKIKNAWKKLLVPEGDYLYTLNRFFSWYYFKAKNPDSYLKNLQTRHLNNLIGA